jgi:hypothetical protein
MVVTWSLFLHHLVTITTQSHRLEDTMSNIVIRNIVGTGPFSTPTSHQAIQALDDAIRNILDGIANFRYLGSKGDINNIEDQAAEVIAIISAFSYNESICPSTSAVRLALSSAFLADPNITSIGDIEIKLVQEGGFYERYPAISRVDDINGIVYFEDNVPPGAQIEVYKYSAHPTSDGDEGYPSNIGKRYRPDRLIAKSSLQIFLGDQIKTVRRNHFRFAFRWPVPDNSGGPGVRGPLGPVTVSTAVPIERTQRGLLVINPSASGMGRH